MLNVLVKGTLLFILSFPIIAGSLQPLGRYGWSQLNKDVHHYFKGTYDIVADGTGLLWLATPAGLMTYDGASASKVKNSVTQESIDKTVVFNLEYANDFIWALTPKYLAKIDPVKKQVVSTYSLDVLRLSHISPSIYFYIDENEMAWFVNHKEIEVLDTHTRKSKFSHKWNEDLNLTSIHSVFLANQKLWVGFNHKVVSLSANDFSLNEINVPKNKRLSKFSYDINANRYQAVYFFDDSLEYVRYGEGAIFQNKEITQKFKRRQYDYELISPDTIEIINTTNNTVVFGLDYIIVLDEAYSPQSYIVRGQSGFDQFVYSQTQAVYDVGSGYILIYDKNYGIQIFRENMFNFEVFEHKVKEYSSDLIENKVDVLRFYSGEKYFWYIASDQKLRAVNKDNHEVSEIGGGKIEAVGLLDASPWLYVTSSTSLFKVDKESHSYEKLVDYPKKTDIYDMKLTDNDKLLLTSSELGFFVFDMSSGVIETQFHKKIFNDSDASILYMSLFNDEDGNVWLYSHFELLKRLDSTLNVSKTFDLKKLGIRNVNDMLKRKNGDLLIATDKGVREVQGDRILPLPMEYGFEKKEIYSLAEDKFGYIWFGSNYGLVRYNPKTGKIINFTKIDGVSGVDFFIDQSQQTEHEVYVLTTRGVTIVHPKQIYPESPVATLSTNEFVSLGNTKKVFNEEDKIVLDYENNNIEIFLQHVDYSQSNIEESIIQYKLHGVDKNWWRVTAGHNRIFYSNLPNGKYEFEAFVENAYFKKSQPIRKMFSVLPPWWRTSQAYFSYITSLIFLFLLVSFYLKRRILEKRQIAKTIKEQKNRLNHALWASGSEMWQWDVQKHHLERSDNAKMICFAEYLQDKSKSEFFYPDELVDATEQFQKVVDGENELFEIKYRIKQKNEDIWLIDRGKITMRFPDGSPRLITGTINDITDLIHKDKKLDLLWKTVDKTPEGIWVAQNDQTIFMVNPFLLEMLGIQESEIIGRKLTDLSFIKQFAQLSSSINALCPEQSNWSGELWITTEHKEFPASIRISANFDEQGEIISYMGFMSDQTQNYESEQEMQRLHNYDVLTNLPNRSYFTDILERYCEASRQKNRQFALLAMNLIDFRLINQLVGHDEGDRIIRDIAENISSIVGSDDMLSRFTGDRFFLLLNNFKNTSCASNIAEKIKEKLISLSSDLTVELKVSIGIAIYPDDTNNAQQLIQYAESAMVHAKNNHEVMSFFAKGMNKRAHLRLTLESRLKKAISSNAFTMYYQPRVSSMYGNVLGAEALIRWFDDGKMIFPDQFIPLAEDIGMISEIDRLVVFNVSEQIKKWHDEGLKLERISLNLSAEQFSDGRKLIRLMNEVEQSIKVPFRHLELEITESMVLHDLDVANKLMYQLQESGIIFAMDDFGTGYSSMSYLMELAVNVVKIDRSFISKCDKKTKMVSMINTIVTMANSLMLQTVAEGVETAGELDVLRNLGCEQYQGYFFSKPVPADQFKESYLKSHVKV